MRAKYIFFAVLLSTAISSFGQIKSPSEFLRNKYGVQFTPNHLVMGYFDHLTESSDKMQKMNYGYTNEGRPLNLYFVSSAKNLNRLESIREQHLSKIGMSR